MSYLQKFRGYIEEHDFSGFIHLWEEYCKNDVVDGAELVEVLEIIRHSEFTKPFGQFVETITPLWEAIEDPALARDVLRLALDLVSGPSDEMANLAMDYLKNTYGKDKYFNEKIRLIGLRSGESFCGAIRNYELLTHMEVGKFVFHDGGWGTGEIVDLSLIREELFLEFEGVEGRRQLSFENAFNFLNPLPDDHFLSLRFGDPDRLEERARKDPVNVVQLALRDLGPLTAAGIKEELCELVIPDEDWSKWWQVARNKIKKDTIIETPKTLKEPFRLRQEEVPHEQRFQEALADVTSISGIIQVMYNFVRDFPEILKDQEVKVFIRGKAEECLGRPELQEAQKVELYVFLNGVFPEEENLLPGIVGDLNLEDLQTLLEGMDITSYKKKVLQFLRGHRSSWDEIFLHFLLILPQHSLRDYLLKELNQTDTLAALKERLLNLRENPTLYPEVFVWYFQKMIGKEDVPFSDLDSQRHFFESFLVLYHFLEAQGDSRDLVKKMYNIISGKRYAVVRKLIEGATLEYTKEFLLLATKCQSLGDHDAKILQSLAEVVHPSLRKKRKGDSAEEDAQNEPIWTTQEGFRMMQEKVQHIGTVEVVDNAREIEVAREHGDLRENAEYKAALERRSRLQGELKRLSDDLNRARILTPQDVKAGVSGVGTIVELQKGDGECVEYTLLGPWEADPDRHILSFQSKLARSISGKKVGDKFSFQDDEFTVRSVRTVFEDKAETR